MNDEVREALAELCKDKIWKDLRATFGTRLAEAGCDAFTIVQLLGHSDIRVTMRYVRMVEGSKRAAVEAVKRTSGKLVTYWSHGIGVNPSVDTVFKLLTEDRIGHKSSLVVIRGTNKITLEIIPEKSRSAAE